MDLGFAHVFQPPADASAPTLLLLHGTGGDERDLLPLAEAIAPSAGVLSPRGKVLEHGMPRFFRRLAMGVFDEADLRFRTGELAEFVEAAAETYGLDPRNVVAVGFSNGANIAASLLLLRPDVLQAAILFSPMVPLEPERLPDLSRVRVFITAGEQDPMVPPENVQRLAHLLQRAGASVTLRWKQGGHSLTAEDVRGARDWLGVATTGSSRESLRESFPGEKSLPE